MPYDRIVRVLGSIALAVLSTFSACGWNGISRDAGTKKDSVTVAVSGGTSYVTHLDPTLQGLRYSPHTHIYDPIARYNPETRAWEPMLALSWERIDRATMRFHLRPNVTFHPAFSI